MTAIRAWLRRSLGDHPVSQRIRHQHELDWFATVFTSCQQNLWTDPQDIVTDITDQKLPNTRTNITNTDTNLPISPYRQPLLEVLLITPHAGLHSADPWKTEFSTSLEESAQRVVEVRQRLQELCGGLGNPAGTYPTAVAQAIQELMKLLPLRSNWAMKSCFTWELPVVWNGIKEKIELTIRFENGNWSINRSLLEAILSLWMFSIKEKETTDIDMEQFSDEKTQKKIMNARLLSSHSERMAKSLLWWVETDGHSPATETRSFRDTLPPDGIMPGPDGDTFRMMGFTDEDLSPRTDEDLSRRTDMAPNEPTYLIAHSSVPIQQLMAQHIFSSFVWAIASYLSPIEAGIHRAPFPPGQKPPREPKVRSERLEELVEKIIRTGLGTREEVYLCIIPSLSAARRLSAADCVADHHNYRTSFHANDNMDRWKSSACIHQEFFDDSLMFSPCSKISVKATFAMVEFLDFLITKEKRTAPDESSLRAIQGLIRDISIDLQRAAKEVLTELLEIFDCLGNASMVQCLIPIMSKAQASPESTQTTNIFGRNQYHIVRIKFSYLSCAIISADHRCSGRTREQTG